MHTAVLLVLAVILPCYHTKAVNDVWTNPKTPLKGNIDEIFQMTKHSTGGLLTDNTQQILEQRNIFDDLWDHLKGPLEQIGTQMILNLGAVATDGVQKAAINALGKRNIDQTLEEVKSGLQPVVLDLWNVVKTTAEEIREVLEQTAGNVYGKRNIFDDIFEHIKEPLKQLGKQTVNSLVGVLLNAFVQQGQFVGKRNTFDDIWQRLNEPLEAAGQHIIHILVESATDALNDATINTLGKSKRNIFDDIWNKVKGPLKQLGKQAAHALVGAAAGVLQQSLINDVGKRDIWSHLWHAIKKPLKATGKQMSHILQVAAGTALTNFAITALGKRDVLSETWDMRPMDTFVTDIADAIMDDVKSNSINGVERRGIWGRLWHAIKKPLKATGKQMAHILQVAAGAALTNFAITALGKRDVLSETWDELKEPLEASVTEIADVIMNDLKNSIPKAAQSDVKNIKDLISGELLSVAEKYFSETFERLDEFINGDEWRSAHTGHMRLPGFLKHLANMHGISLTKHNLPSLAKLIISHAVTNAHTALPHRMISKLHSIMHLLSKITTDKQT